MSWHRVIADNWYDERFRDPVLVGIGAYGWVLKCYDNEMGRIVAVKYFPFPREEDVPREEDLQRRVLREIAALHTLNHPNVVRMEVEYAKISMEYVNSDLCKYLKDVGRVDPNEIKVGNRYPFVSFMFQIFQGLSHCHSHSIVHCDLKPDNLLLDLNTKTIKIADFCHIKRLDDPPSLNKITNHRYNPPETLLRMPELTTAADIWSLGCTFAEMVKGSRLFSGLYDYVVMTKIIKLLGPPNEQAWPGVTHACLHLLGEEDPEAELPPRELDLAQVFSELEQNALNLLTQMLRFLPSERISAADALQHPYFHGLQHNQ